MDQVEKLIEGLGPLRIAEGTFNGYEIKVKLKKSRDAVFYKWQVRTLIICGFNAGIRGRSFIRKKNAVKCFEDLVRKYHLKKVKIGGRK